MGLSQSDLDQFIGSEVFYRHVFGGLIFTEGVKFLADEGGAYWLIDAIASYQNTKQIVQDPMLRDFQIWNLTRKDDNSAVLTCKKDSNYEPAIVQNIPWTDFPLEKIDLWAERGEHMTLMLPSER